MNRLLITGLLTFTLFYSCLSTKTFSEINGTIDYETVIGISIASNRADRQLTKYISNQDSIKTFVTALNESLLDGPWKGANWDKIILVCTDTTITLNTNGKVFGVSSSGQFFKLNKQYQNE